MMVLRNRAYKSSSIETNRFYSLSGSAAAIIRKSVKVNKIKIVFSSYFLNYLYLKLIQGLIFTAEDLPGLLKGSNGRQFFTG